MSKDVENNTEKSLIEFVYKFVQNCLASKPVIVLGVDIRRCMAFRMFIRSENI